MAKLFLLGLIVITALLVLGYCMSRMPGRSLTGAVPGLTAAERILQKRLHEHVVTLATDIGERNVWQPENLQRAMAYIEESLRQTGLEVRSIPYPVGDMTVRNVEAECRGRANAPGSLVVGAHYDSLRGTTGANDNASGVAVLLELARICGRLESTETLRFVAFVNEEPPFFKTPQMGSYQYLEQLMAAGERVTGMISLETIGYYTDQPSSQNFPLPLLRFFYPTRGYFLAFVGNLHSAGLLRRSLKAFRQAARFPSEGIVSPGWVPGVDWSDHWAFWKNAVPAIMLTDTAPYRYPHYHQATDTLDKIDFSDLARITTGLESVIAALAR